MLEPKKITAIEAFTISRIQEFIFMEKHFRKHGVTLDELLEYKAHQAYYIQEELERQQVLFESLARECPECRGIIRPYPITIPQGPANLYGYQSVWLCDTCLYERYMTTPFKTLREGLMKEANDGTD